MKAVPILAAALALSGCAAEVAGQPRFLVGGTPAGDYTIAISTMEQAKFAGVIRQKYDFSCGSAALATLLRHHYDYNVREDNAFRGMWANGDQEKIRAVGFSLLDMKRWLASRGLKADGYELDLDVIEETGIPGIALISIKSYRHFVVVKGVRNDEVLLGDPSAGVIIMSRAEFEKSWNGVYFALSDDRELARQNFSSDPQWSTYVRAPIGQGFSNPVSQQELMLTAPFYGDI